MAQLTTPRAIRSWGELHSASADERNPPSMRKTPGVWGQSPHLSLAVPESQLGTRHAMASDEQKIRTVHSIWVDSINAGDLARLLTLVAKDAVFLTPGQAPFGRKGFSSNFMAAHQQMRICCTSELEEVVVVGEVAYTRSRDALSVTPRTGGKAAQHAGHRMTVLTGLWDRILFPRHA
jgi:uncharacterized protein (TIGR02246 family)